MDEVIKLEKKHSGELPFSDFIESYKHQVYQICFYMIGKRNEAEQIAQTAFIEVFMNIRDYNFGKVPSKLFRITVDLILDWLREKTTNNDTELEMAESIESIQQGILQLAVNDRFSYCFKTYGWPFRRGDQ